MADIYGQELKIPEKPRRFGWIIVAVGGLMILIAVGIFLQQNRELARIKEKPWEKPQAATQAYTSSEGESLFNKIKLHKVFLLWVVLVLSLLMLFTIAVLLSHRIAQRLRAATGKPLSKTRITDPWKESADRIEIPENLDE